MVFLAKNPMVSNYDLSSLRIFWVGAAPLSKELQDSVYDRLGRANLIIRQGYGMTEQALATLAQTDRNHKPGSVGVLREGVWGKIIDPETTKSLGPNERGELLLKGKCIMKGYIGDEASTKNSIDLDGWLHTGDIAFYDKEGEFYIVDRLKELIKYKGYQVPPAELEGILLQNSKISDAAVIGIPDEEAGELPMAFIVKQKNVNLTAQEVIDYVADRTSTAKRLHGGVQFLNEIPKNPSGKILRRELRTLFGQHKSKL